jgi:hypothetical protein
VAAVAAAGAPKNPVDDDPGRLKPPVEDEPGMLKPPNPENPGSDPAVLAVVVVLRPGPPQSNATFPFVSLFESLSATAAEGLAPAIVVDAAVAPGRLKENDPGTAAATAGAGAGAELLFGRVNTGAEDVLFSVAPNVNNRGAAGAAGELAVVPLVVDRLAAVVVELGAAAGDAAEKPPKLNAGAAEVVEAVALVSSVEGVFAEDIPYFDSISEAYLM